MHNNFKQYKEVYGKSLQNIQTICDHINFVRIDQIQVRQVYMLWKSVGLVISGPASASKARFEWT